MRSLFLLIPCCMLSHALSLLAQTNDSTQKGLPPDQYIQYMSNYINLKLALNTSMDELSVLTDTKDIYLSPNADSESRLYFNYRFISFSVRYLPKWVTSNNDNDLKGKTKGTGFGLNLNFNRWLQDISYSKTKGYYLANMQDFYPGWSEGNPYIQFPKLEYKIFQGISVFKFNPNYSINAVATQTERQIRSAGSFIPHLLYRYYIIDNKVELGNTGSSQKSNNFEIVLGAGYYHTFVLKNDFYFSIGATPGVGAVFTRLTTRYPDDEIITNQKNAIFRMDGRAGAGYNGLRFFAGVYSKLLASSVQQQKTSVINQDTRLAFQGFVGYRLNAPKWMKDNVDNVGRVIGR